MTDPRYTTVVTVATTRDGDNGSTRERSVTLADLREPDAELIFRHMIKMAEEWRDWFRGMHG